MEVDAIAVDTSGNLVIGGSTTSLKLPTSPVVLTTNRAPSGNPTGFVAKINPNVPGSAGLLYGTYLGGAASDRVNAVAIDSSGNLYAGGAVESADFPVTPNAARTTGAEVFGNFAGAREGFVTKLNPGGTVRRRSYTRLSTAGAATTKCLDSRWTRRDAW